MLLADYRAAQRNDLRDLGLGPYFQDADLDDFHARALREYGRYRPLLRPFALLLTAGEESVDLPPDWQGVHPPSFESALGIAGSYSPIPTSYGLVYAAAAQGRPPVAGLEMDFAGSSLVADPWQGHTTAANPLYTFLTGNPPRLIIRPAPITSGSFPIFYFAQHALPLADSAGTVPDADADLILAWACHLACEAALGDPDMLSSYKVGDREVRRDEFARQVAAKSARKRDEFENRTRHRPVGSMG